MRALNYICGLFFVIIASCSKSKYLDAKPDDRLIVPKTFSHYQAILDNEVILNGNGSEGVVPILGESGADNYYVIPGMLDALGDHYRRVYTWSDGYKFEKQFVDWELGYRAVFYSNLVLEGLSSIDISIDEKPNKDNAKGSALFYRAFSYFNLAQIFTPPYEKSISNQKLGLPLRLTSSVYEILERSTLEQTYEQILKDLKEALPLLPDFPKDNVKTRPSKHAVYALLSRVYLILNEYDESLKYADSCLQLRNSLLNFNTDINTATPNTPFARYNSEVIFHSRMVTSAGGGALVVGGYIDSTLYNSYDSNDLRKLHYFRLNASKRVLFKGSYDGSNNLFAGLATDEIYLTRAECYARLGQLTEAVQDLNHLLSFRWKEGNYIPFEPLSIEEALNLILLERRKELIHRGLRWVDLRRLNKLDHSISITRKIIDAVFTLSPNDLHYTYLIPEHVMGYNPDMFQNPR